MKWKWPGMFPLMTCRLSRAPDAASATASGRHFAAPVIRLVHGAHQLLVIAVVWHSGIEVARSLPIPSLHSHIVSTNWLQCPPTPKSNHPNFFGPRATWLPLPSLFNLARGPHQWAAWPAGRISYYCAYTLVRPAGQVFFNRWISCYRIK